VITSPADDGCANTAEFLRLRLRIGKSEATRRLALAADILPATTLTGDTIPAPREHLAAALTPTPASTGTPHTEDSTGTDTDAGPGSDTEDTAGTEGGPGSEDHAENLAASIPAVSSRAGTIIALTLNRLQHLTTPRSSHSSRKTSPPPLRPRIPTSSPASPAAGPTPSTPTAPNPAKKPSATPKARSSANPATACTTSKSSPPPTNTNTSSPS
jgi:hypothetical protein